MSNKVLGKPESHSDVITKQPEVLLIGYGWVGQFVHKYFPKADFYTPEAGLRNSEGTNLVPPWDHPEAERQAAAKGKHVWDVAFVGVPTPMKENGDCDTSIVESAIERWRYFVDLFIIRSTVEPGTCERLAKRFKTRVVFQPEYVGETLGHPLIEPSRDTFIILGGDREDTAIAAEMWSTALHPNSRIYQVSGKTAEWCKYMENSFLGTKVTFVNGFRLSAEADGVNFHELREIWLLDQRIGRSHTFAYKDNPGFSGKCLPKDLNAIAKYARRIGAPLHIVESILKINAAYRAGIPTSVQLLPKPVDQIKVTITPGKPENGVQGDKPKAAVPEGKKPTNPAK